MISWAIVFFNLWSKVKQFGKPMMFFKEIKTRIFLESHEESQNNIFEHRKWIAIDYKLTWIPLQLSLNKIVRERAKLFHPTDGNITALYFSPLFIKLVVNLNILRIRNIIKTAHNFPPKYLQTHVTSNIKHSNYFMHQGALLRKMARTVSMAWSKRECKWICISVIQDYNRLIATEAFERLALS